MAARLQGAGATQAVQAGHRLAGAVIGHRGAIIALDAMPGMAEISPHEPPQFG